MGLIDVDSGRATPELLKLEESLPPVKNLSGRLKKDGGEGGEGEGVRGEREREVEVEGGGGEGATDGGYEERRKEKIEEDLQEVKRRLTVNTTPCHSTCLCVYLPTCLSVCLSIYLSVCLPVCLSVYLSVYLSACP